MVGALAVAVFALQAQAGPKAKTYTKLNAAIEQSEQGVIPVVKHSAGNVATAGASKATVYGNPIDNGYFVPQQAVIADTPAVFQADDMAFGNGFVAGGSVFAYNMRVLNNGTVNAGVDIHVDLYDGDPLALINTTAGFTNAAIAGTGADFLGLGGANLVTVHELEASFAKVAIARPNGVWMVWTTPNGCRLGWRLSQAPAAIGFSDDLFEVAENEDSLGFCCQDNTIACVAQADCGSAARELCVDNGAEFSGIFFFGGCGATNDNCANFYGNIFAPAKTEIKLDPVENAGAAGVYSGQEVTLTDPVTQNRVYLQVDVRGWSTNIGTGPERLKNIQATIDETGLASGLGTPLDYAYLFCDSTIPDDAACQAARFTGFGGQGSCNPNDFTGTGGSNLDQCLYAWQDTIADPDWVHRCCGPVNATDVSTPSVRGGSVVNSGQPPFWDGLDNNVFLLMLDVDAGSRGSYTVGFRGAPDTFALDQNNNPLPLLGLTPAIITIEVGQCCYNIGPTTTLCSDGLLASECAQKAAPRAFFPGQDCTSECPSCQANADCADSDCCTVDTCDTATGVCSNTAVALTGDNDCCDSASAGCNDLLGTGAQCDSDDGNQCTADACSNGGSSGTCGSTPTTDVCDNGDDCDFRDICDGAGNCVGTLPGTVPCVIDQDCADATGQANFICKDGTCFCPVTPDLEFVKDNAPADNCYGDGDKVSVRVVRGVSGDPIAGAQVAITYDPACLDFLSISPGASCDPASNMTMELFESVDEAAGTIFYAVGLTPGNAATGGAETVACLSFAKVNDTCADCNLCFTNDNPRHTYLSSDEGQPVQVIPHCSKDINAADEITLTVPDDQSKNSGCDSPTAHFTWAAPTASADCGDVVLDCDGGTGGEYPQGTTTLCCTARSVDCPSNSVTDCWTVTVSDQMTLDLTIQLSPIMKGDGIVRCIKFEQYADCIQDPQVFERNILFGGLYDYIGHYTDTIKKPKGQFSCISARDQLHSLRACYLFAAGDCDGGVLSATFKGDPILGGNWLTQGNLDGWKKDNPNASHDVIDILDFGQYVSQYGATGLDPNTPCGYTGGNADINGDGRVDALDFAFVSMNFLAESKDCCCPGDQDPAAAPVALTEVSVRDLRTMGMSDLAVADLNGDGLVNMEDMANFMQGNVGTTKPVRKGDIRSFGGTK
jgi:hypothetical protein